MIRRVAPGTSERDDVHGMIGLLVTLNDQPQVAVAQAEDGVITVIAHVLCAEKEDRLVQQALLEVGALMRTDGGDRFVKWLNEALGPGDQIEVVVAEIESPTPWSEDLPWPVQPTECPIGVEVYLNDVVAGTKTAAQPNSVATAIVSWSRGAKTNPTPGEYIHLDVGLDYSKLLAVGDTVLIRVLGG